MLVVACAVAIVVSGAPVASANVSSDGAASTRSPAMGPTSSQACTDVWIGSTDPTAPGDWNTGSNWSTGAPPQANGVSCLPTGSQVTVSSGESAVTGTLQGAAASITIDGGSTLSLNNSIADDQIGQLVLAGGGLFDAGNLTIENGTSFAAAQGSPVAAGFGHWNSRVGPDEIAGPGSATLDGGTGGSNVTISLGGCLTVNDGLGAATATLSAGGSMILSGGVGVTTITIDAGRGLSVLDGGLGANTATISTGCRGNVEFAEGFAATTATISAGGSLTFDAGFGVQTATFSAGSTLLVDGGFGGTDISLRSGRTMTLNGGFGATSVTLSSHCAIFLNGGFGATDVEITGGATATLAAGQGAGITDLLLAHATLVNDGTLGVNGEVTGESGAEIDNYGTLNASGITFSVGPGTPVPLLFNEATGSLTNDTSTLNYVDWRYQGTGYVQPDAYVFVTPPSA